MPAAVQSVRREAMQWREGETGERGEREQNRRRERGERRCGVEREENKKE